MTLSQGAAPTLWAPEIRRHQLPVRLIVPRLAVADAWHPKDPDRVLGVVAQLAAQLPNEWAHETSAPGVDRPPKGTRNRDGNGRLTAPKAL